MLEDSDVGARPSGAPSVDSAPSEVPAPPAPSSLPMIEDTFRIVSRAGDKAVAYFYGRLSAETPQLRVMFPAAMDFQRDRLFGALTRIVHTLGTPEDMEPFVCQLGQDHPKYRVQPAHYPAARADLLATLR